jgi:hypothetical protein
MKRIAATFSIALLVSLAATAVASAKSSPQLRRAHPASHSLEQSPQRTGTRSHSVRLARHHAAL